jgi:hypothetical protein
VTNSTKPAKPPSALEKGLRQSVAWIEAEGERVGQEAEAAGESFWGRIDRYGFMDADEVAEQKRKDEFFRSGTKPR